MDTVTDATLARRLRSVLLDLARQQDDLAANEAAATPYWSQCPHSVQGRRAAATALRAEADLVLGAS